MAKMKITYSTLSADNEELHAAFDEGLVEVRAKLGETHPIYVNGEARTYDDVADKMAPADTRVLMGKFTQGTEKDVEDAIAASKAAQPEWAADWKHRIAVMRKAADLISERGAYMSALLSMEVGKNRLEALGDVEETADLIRYACDQLEKNNGYDQPMGQLSPKDRTRDVLKPHGVWAVISPFNFPSALTGGPSGAALVAGNAVIMKPAHDTPWIVEELYKCFVDGGVPKGVAHYISGRGSVVGNALVNHPGIDGMTFTGSYNVGMGIYNTFSQKVVRPCIIELGGKNPAIVSNKADLEKASLGVMRSAFGLQGQKCSAASRVYVHSDVRDAFMEKLLERTRAIKIGDPTARDTYMGPVVNKNSYNDFISFAETAHQDGTILHGGKAITDGDFRHGYFVEPTIVTGVPEDHPVFAHTEMFVPIVTVWEYKDLDHAMMLANNVQYGLTAGMYSEDDGEIQFFLNNIQAGVVYVNRPAGATTGAWPGVQPFGGWKGSGSTGKNAGGPYYLPLYMREQSQTIIES